MSAPDLRANEITVDGKGLSENSYDPSLNIEPVALLKNELFKCFPETLKDDFTQWDLIGKTEADGKNYFQSTISLTYTGPPPNHVTKQWGVPFEVDCIDCYTIKYQLESQKKVLKVYDGAYEALPELPEGSQLGTQFGVGCHFGDEELARFRDVYFFNPDLEVVNRFFDVDLPTLDWDKGPSLKLFGLCFDHESKKMVKLKRYLYPSDPKIEFPEDV